MLTPTLTPYFAVQNYLAMENKKALIFGASGQDGYYLSLLLSKNGITVINISRNGSGLKGDAGDHDFVEDVIKDKRPDYIFHLAANSTTKHTALYENQHVVVNGALHILESARSFCPAARIFIAGSALQFRNEGKPINEKTPFEASSAYALARIQSTYAARYFRDTFGMKVFVGYFFNHDSSLRTENHVNQKIVMAAKRFSLGEKGKLRIGDIHVQKEFNFAGDMTEAAWKLVSQDKIAEAVLGCGRAYTIKEWLTCCFEGLGLNWQDFVEQDNQYKREYDVLVSDPRLLFEMGWAPAVNFYQLADMMLKGGK